MIDRRGFLLRTAAWGAVAAVHRAAGAAPSKTVGGDWRADGARLNQRLADLSRFGRNPQGGVSRVAFSEADVQGRAFAMEMMRGAGLDVQIDPVGNILGRREGQRRDAPPILFGSHIDSVPEGGNYDGDVGSMAAIEVAHVLHERGYANRQPLVVAIWCDEESGLTGSRGFVGDFRAEELGRPGRDGVPLADKIRRIGGDPDRLPEARHDKGSVAAYVELHIEQGGRLDEKGVPIGVVEGIVGIHHYDLTIRGFANHAGTTPMDKRQNALLAAADIALSVDRVVRSVPGRHVGTVGRLIVRPGAPNVIPGEVLLTVELRDLKTETIEALWARIAREIHRAVEQNGCTMQVVERTPDRPALTDPRLREIIAGTADRLGLRHLSLPSGAGHDAQELARICPVGMIFIPSVGGISHSPRELSRPEDITNGGNVLLQTILRLDQGELSTLAP